MKGGLFLTTADSKIIDEKYAKIIRFAGEISFTVAQFILVFMMFYDETAFEYFLGIFKFGGFSTAIYLAVILLIGWEYYNFRFTAPTGISKSNYENFLALQRIVFSDKKILKKHVHFTFFAVTFQIIEEIIFRGMNLLILHHFGFFWAAAAVLPISFIWGCGHFGNNKHYKYAISRFDLRWRLGHNTISGAFYSILALATGGIFLSAIFHGLWNLIVNAREYLFIRSYFKKNPR